MMMCTLCKKEKAVICLTMDINQQQKMGLCKNCISKLSIPGSEEAFKQLGEHEEYIDMLNERLKGIFGDCKVEIVKDTQGDSDDAETASEIQEVSVVDKDEQQENDVVKSEVDESDTEVESDTDDDRKVDDFKNMNKITFITNDSINNLLNNMVNGMNQNINDSSIDDADENDIDENDDDFIPGGAAAFPFLSSLFSDNVNFTNMSGNKKNKKKKSKRKHLDTYCTNLTAKAKNGEIDRVIGRDREIDRLIQILSRRTKNNPCLIGEPGVGKTAIVESVAIRIADGNVPMRLKDKEIYLLDLTALIAGTQFRGQFESRIKGLVNEVKQAKNVILFIDEVHNLIGTGDSEGTMNAGNLLKPALSRGEIQVIGATTFSEYRKYIEKDSALERRFQPITVEEPSINDTITVLLGIKSYYEKYHRVSVSKDIITSAVVLSERYITDRFLPDKAIDLLDESCAYASLKNKKLEEYDKLNDEMQNHIKEEKSLEENDKESPDYEKLAKVRYEIARLSSLQKTLESEAINKAVTEEDLAHVIELWTGIPAAKVQETDVRKLATLSDHLKEKIIGQDHAVELVSAAIQRNRIGISPRRRPASFIFVGPTGVGKTELVKVLSEELFDTPETLIRLDMSEFMEKHSVSRIIGSPPGYVGYDEAGQMTEKVRRRPYSVLLFDEIEKAHPDVMNILLQILDEGKITDAQGRVVNFEHTIIIMTSNAGSNQKGGSMGFGKNDYDMTKEKVMKALEEFLRPEFMSRVDEIVIFKNLDEEAFKKIAKLMLNEYVDIMKEKDIKLEYDDEVLAYLAKKSTGDKSGARNLRSFIRKEVEDKIAKEIILRNGAPIESIKLVVEKDSLHLETK